MTQRKVVSGYQDNEGSYVVVLDDGSQLFWHNVEKRWVDMLPPLPPEALDESPAPDLGEWPGKPDVPPDTSRDVEILTPHGAFRAFRSSRYGWCAYSADRNNCAPVDPRDVLRWRELPLAFVDEDGRVTGVTRG